MAEIEAPARSSLGVPLPAHEAMRLEQLERLGLDGWGREPSGAFFVDMKPRAGEEPERFHGETLHVAIGRALRARSGGRP